MELLAEQANQLILQWPKYNMHDATKCQLRPHPCHVQVLDLPPELKVSDVDHNNSPMLCRLTKASLH